MAQAVLINPDETTTKIETWFSETYGTTEKLPEETQLLILYKIHQLEERLKKLEHQTKTHWVN